MKRKTKRILNAILVVLVALATVTGIVALVNHLKADEDGFDKVNLSYQIGGLDENGKYEETKGSIYTKKSINLNSGDELQFTVDFDNDIEYQLFFYDGNDEFVSKSEVLSKNYKHVADAETNVRVLITPVWDEEIAEEDREINLFTMVKYSSQLTVEVKSIEEVELSEFVFKNDEELTVYFEDGMTWEEFINSDYNTIGLDTNEQYVRFEDSEGITLSGENHLVKLEELIKSGTYCPFWP